jgi:hypothetical protein
VCSSDLVTGAGSEGVIAQSINGGGGTLKLDLKALTGMSGVPYLDRAGKVTTDPRLAARIGGEGVKHVSSGSTQVILKGTVKVGGAYSAGAFNQAVSGGGGVARVNAEFAGDAASPTADEAPIDVDVVLGGIDGVGNVGGDLDSDHIGDILTNGAGTHGVLDQSIGGGGGRAVVNLVTPKGADVGDVSLALGGENGVDEIGGLIERLQNGGITTTDQGAAGAILQSIGGGGGLASLDLTGADAAAVKPSVNLGSIGGSGLHGGQVKASFTGDTVTYGDHAPGMVVQSVGAGGGVAIRSEERRVGKECRRLCRSRWSPYH